MGPDGFAQPRSPASPSNGADNVVVTGADGLESAVESFKPTVILDSLGGPFTDAAIAAIENQGRLVVYGTSNDEQVSINLRRLYRKGVTLLGYGGMIDTPQEQRTALDKLLAMMSAGSLHDPGRRRLASRRRGRGARPNPRARRGRQDPPRLSTLSCNAN